MEPAFRERVAAQLREVAGLSEEERRTRLGDLGLVSPHYPEPYGLSATPAQQLVIAEEFAHAGIPQPSTVIGEWALPTILAHGTKEQQDSFVRPTLRGDITWCQLFSEPGAGSDLASLSTRAEKVEGGWRINGQKVWNSMAQHADWGILLARTNPDVPKHKGISYFLVDMKSEGLDVRPLREANGNYMFNEVFFNDVFIPDDRLVGEADDGWRLARTTLGNERVSIGSGMGVQRFGLAELIRSDVVAGNAGAVGTYGRLTAESYALAAMGLRLTLRRLEGLTPGGEASVLKLAAVKHRTDVARVAMSWYGPEAAALDGAAGQAVQDYLSTPASLIGGGTTEIQLNVISERVLGLPGADLGTGPAPGRARARVRVRPPAPGPAPARPPPRPHPPPPPRPLSVRFWSGKGGKPPHRPVINAHSVGSAVWRGRPSGRVDLDVRRLEGGEELLAGPQPHLRDGRGGDVGEQRGRALETEANPVAARFHAADGDRPAVARAAQRGVPGEGDGGRPHAQQHRPARRRVADGEPPAGVERHLTVPRRPAQQGHADQPGDVVRAGPAGDLGGVALLRDRAAFEHEQPVTEQQRLHRIVGHQDGRGAVVDEMAAQLLADLQPGRGVQRAERFVEEHQRRAEGQRPGERDARRLPS